MLDYLDLELKSFINQYVTSFLAWDLLVFFHKNPGVADVADQLAIKLGRLTDDIERAAGELAEKAVLKQEHGIFMYEPDDKVRSRVGEFVSALDDRETRLLILTEVLQRR